MAMIKLTGAEQQYITFWGKGVVLEKRYRKWLYVLLLLSKKRANKAGVFRVTVADYVNMDGAIRVNSPNERFYKDLWNSFMDLLAMGKVEQVAENKYKLNIDSEDRGRVKQLGVSPEQLGLSKAVGMIKRNVEQGFMMI